MRVPRISLILALGLFLSQEVRAQDSYAEIAGRAVVPTEFQMRNPNPAIKERATEIIELPASNTEVILVAQGDTLRDRTSPAGSFSFKQLPVGPVHLSISFANYEPFSETIDLVPGKNVVIVAFRKKTETLDAAVVKDKMPVVTQRGDTLVYHARAVAQREGDYAIDLLRQFPGVEVKDGQIVVTGKQVKRSYVNGALVFGLDPMASMEYLKADQVTTMDVYDEADPADRLDGITRERQRVINIKTKDPIFKTMDLQVRALAGADQQPRDDGRAQLRYTLGTNAHFFSELKQLSADVATGNIGMRSSSINLTPGPLSTYTDNTDLKLGFNRYWVSPLFGNGLQVAYTFGHEKNRSRRRTLQEYFETAGIPDRTTDNETDATSRVQRHGMTASYNYRTGKKVSFGWQHGLDLSRNESARDLLEQVSVGGGDPMRREESSRSDTRSWQLRESVNLNFLKPGKSLPALTLSMQMGRNRLDSWDLDTLASSYTKRYLTKEGRGLSRNWTAQARQSLWNWRPKNTTNPEQMLRSFQLTAEYRFNWSSQKREQAAWDLWGTPDPLVNAANTFDFTYASMLNSLELQAQYIRSANFVVMARLAAQAERVTDDERIPAIDPVKRVYWRLSPTVNMSLKGVTVSFSSMARVPSVEQLRRWVNDTNPLALIAGNPDLKQSQSYTLSVGKHTMGKATNHVLTWDARAEMEVNPIVSKTTFYASDTVLDAYNGYQVKAGSTLMRSENSDYGFSASGNAMLSSQWGGKWKVASMIRPSLSFRFLPQYFGEVLDRTAEWTPSLNASGSMFPVQNTLISFNANLAYIRAKSQAGTMDRQAVRSNLTIGVKTDFLKRAFFNGDWSWVRFDDLTAPEMGSDVHRLNLSLGIGLLKDKALKISISGIDLLRGGTLYSVAAGPSSLTRTWTPVYGRYFLIDISYRFNNNTSSGNMMMGTR
jgi:hypothetical protein